jgi:hypothetical protein
LPPPRRAEVQNSKKQETCVEAPRGVWSNALRTRSLAAKGFGARREGPQIVH